MNVREWIEEQNEEALLADGFDAAIVGMCERYGAEPVVAYDRDVCIEILAHDFENDNDDPDLDVYEEAEDYFSYNIAGSYVGDNMPVFITFYPLEEDEESI